MAITYNIYTATASQTTFAITFPYIESTHVKVQINGVDTTSFSISGSNVVLDSGAAVGEKVKVYRQTPGREADAKIMLVDFQDGSVLSEAELDKACLQLLYLAQEADETGASSLPVDWDGNYTAGSKRIKNLSTTVTGDQDAATKEYVDAASLYGGAVTLPQSWAYLGSDSGWSNPAGSDWQITLTSPTPNSANADLFVVSINGLTQRPTADFTVTEVGEAYILKLLGWADKAASDVISIMNFGASRNWIDLPLKGASASDVALTVQRHTDGQSANLQEWVTEASTPVVLASVNEDGDASFVDVTATGNAAVTGTSTLTGNTTVGGTLGVTGASTVGGTLGVTGATTLSGGVSGNLNILTGSLQFGGVASTTILQIVQATRNTSTASVSSASPTYAGIDITIAPKSSSSKLLFVGTHAIEARGTGSKGRPLFQGLMVGASDSGSAAGTAVSGADKGDASKFVKFNGTSEYLYWVASAFEDNNMVPTTFNISALIDNESTDSRVYSFVISPYYSGGGWNPNASGSASTYYNYGYQRSDIYCIELG